MCCKNLFTDGEKTLKSIKETFKLVTKTLDKKNIYKKMVKLLAVDRPVSNMLQVFANWWKHTYTSKSHCFKTDASLPWSSGYKSPNPPQRQSLIGDGKRLHTEMTSFIWINRWSPKETWDDDDKHVAFLSRRHRVGRHEQRKSEVLGNS